VTSHGYHKDVHEHGLQDDCDRCQELAEDPFNLTDLDVFRSLVWRIDNDRPPRSMCENAAMSRIRRTILEFEYLQGRGRK
jgi:hypothetical protein